MMCISQTELANRHNEPPTGEPPFPFLDTQPVARLSTAIVVSLHSNHCYPSPTMCDEAVFACQASHLFYFRAGPSRRAERCRPQSRPQPRHGRTRRSHLKKIPGRCTKNHEMHDGGGRRCSWASVHSRHALFQCTPRTTAAEYSSPIQGRSGRTSPRGHPFTFPAVCSQTQRRWKQRLSVEKQQTPM